MARFLGVEEPSEGRHFDRAIIVLCVRWYQRFKLKLPGPAGNDGRALFDAARLRFLGDR
jgi:hypothetical protein